MSHRRLPVYLVLDCSGSMSGEPIEAVRQGVKALLSDLMSDPMALESVYLSVITFSSDAQIVPLTELALFSEPVIQASGSTALGAALRLLDRSLTEDVRPSTPSQKGDYRPLVFLMTDGQPTDEWEGPADAIKTRKLGNIIACAAGAGAQSEALKRVTETVVELKSLQPEQLRSFFRWVSASVAVASEAIQGGPVALPTPPAGIKLVL